MSTKSSGAQLHVDLMHAYDRLIDIAEMKQANLEAPSCNVGTLETLERAMEYVRQLHALCVQDVKRSR